MAEDLPNMFDEFARHANKPQGKKLGKKKRHVVADSSANVTPLEKSEKGDNANEMREMLDRIDKMRKDIEGKLSDIENQTSYLPKNLKEILENPETVDEQHVAKLMKSQEELEQKVGGILGGSFSAVTGPKKEKKEKKQGQKSSKIRERKNWLRME